MFSAVAGGLRRQSVDVTSSVEVNCTSTLVARTEVSTKVSWQTGGCPTSMEKNLHGKSIIQKVAKLSFTSHAG